MTANSLEFLHQPLPLIRADDEKVPDEVPAPQHTDPQPTENPPRI